MQTARVRALAPARQQRRVSVFISLRPKDGADPVGCATFELGTNYQSFAPRRFSPQASYAASLSIDLDNSCRNWRLAGASNPTYWAAGSTVLAINIGTFGGLVCEIVS